MMFGHCNSSVRHSGYRYTLTCAECYSVNPIAVPNPPAKQKKFVWNKVCSTITFTLVDSLFLCFYSVMISSWYESGTNRLAVQVTKLKLWGFFSTSLVVLSAASFPYNWPTTVAVALLTRAFSIRRKWLEALPIKQLPESFSGNWVIWSYMQCITAWQLESASFLLTPIPLSRTVINIRIYAVS